MYKGVGEQSRTEQNAAKSEKSGRQEEKHGRDAHDEREACQSGSDDDGSVWLARGVAVKGLQDDVWTASLPESRQCVGNLCHCQRDEQKNGLGVVPLLNVVHGIFLYGYWRDSARKEKHAKIPNPRANAT